MRQMEMQITQKRELLHKEYNDIEKQHREKLIQVTVSSAWICGHAQHRNLC
jgi:hypothetical protein